MRNRPRGALIVDMKISIFTQHSCDPQSSFPITSPRIVAQGFDGSDTNSSIPQGPIPSGATSCSFGFFPPSTVIPLMIGTLPALIIATLVGAKLYKE
jgi:hypothetical protein